VQHRDEARSRVLGIDIDRTALQRAEGDLSGTEPGTAIDCDAA
jgi:chemotaxis methyl-accepting protein methylase